MLPQQRHRLQQHQTQQCQTKLLRWGLAAAPPTHRHQRPMAQHKVMEITSCLILRCLHQMLLHSQHQQRSGEDGWACDYSLVKRHWDSGLVVSPPSPSIYPASPSSGLHDPPPSSVYQVIRGAPPHPLALQMKSTGGSDPLPSKVNVLPFPPPPGSETRPPKYKR